MNRRSLITGLVAFAAAPAIVRASSLMRIKPDLRPIPGLSEWIEAYYNGCGYRALSEELNVRFRLQTYAFGVSGLQNYGLLEPPLASVGG